MKKIILELLFLISLRVFCAQPSLPSEDSMAMWFKNIKEATKRNYMLWDRNLYGPILLVDTATKQVYSNYRDSAGALVKKGKIYKGQLPKSIAIANYSFHWNGRDWAMIMLNFLAPDSKGKINLMAHELFHKAQTTLHFPRQNNRNNNHLDLKEGRIYLRLELEALQAALNANRIAERIEALTNALTFRKYRYLLYPGAEESENEMELNEGLAEYTGAIISGRNKQEMHSHFESNQKKFLANPSFTRTFAYYTIPVYGFLLSLQSKHWNKQIKSTTNLASYFIGAFHLNIPTDLKASVKVIANRYHSPTILQEENEREDERQRLIAEYTQRFFTKPDFVIELVHKNISFDARRVLALEGKGTVYVTMTARDDWGVLTVNKGALLNDKGTSIRLSPPLIVEDSTVAGDGWILNLSSSYQVVQDKQTGKFKLVKK